MYVFFIRSFNDVDHIAPVVYRLAGMGERVNILCQDPDYDIAADFRLCFLRNRFPGIVVQYLHAAHPSGGGSPWFDEEWARQCLELLQARVVVFDYVINAEQFATAPLLHASARLGIPTVGMTPGVPIFAEDYFPEDDIFKSEAETTFDYNIVPHAAAATYRIRHGVAADRVVVLGSPRFCPEWRQVLDRIVEPVAKALPRADGRLRVVYMERGADLHGAFHRKIADTIAGLSNLDCIQLLIKPHPRLNRFQLAEEGVSYNISWENSLNLIRWSDVVIGANTSILIDVLSSGKVLLYPKYFHADRMIFDVMEACLRVDSYEELEAALRQLYDNKDIEPYPEKNVRQLLDYLVLGGRPDRDVLGDYVAFLMQISKQQAAV